MEQQRCAVNFLKMPDTGPISNEPRPLSSEDTITSFAGSESLHFYMCHLNGQRVLSQHCIEQTTIVCRQETGKDSVVER